MQEFPLLKAELRQAAHLCTGEWSWFAGSGLFVILACEGEDP
ncbi:MAG TPA: hypothetical protein VK819_05085 [Acidobacteriaceae bacterium]|jgi:hypothetical protein|nr:hypothetical protein [Acidobacteriaceae bacterium]